MLFSFEGLRGYGIHATDGDIGSVRDVYFDDVGSSVRYFVVDTGSWLPGRARAAGAGRARDRRPRAAKRSTPA